jgi:hypothetical protein
MTYLGFNLTHRFKSLRKSSSSYASSHTSIDSSLSESSFASFPTDPLTKAPVQPLPKKQVLCSPSWGLIVALNQSDDQPGLPDEERLQEFLRRSSLYNSDLEEHITDASGTPPLQNPFNEHDPKSSIQQPSEKTRSNQQGLDVEIDTKFESHAKESPSPTTAQRLRRLSHRASFSALSDRYTWLKPQSGTTSATGKHEYAKLQTDEADSKF